MIITAENNYQALDNWTAERKKILLVCDDSIRFLKGISKKLKEIRDKIILYDQEQE